MTDVFNNTFPGDGTSFAKLFRWLGAIAGKTPDAATRTEINATTAGVTYDETTDSLEAIQAALGSTGAGPGSRELTWTTKRSGTPVSAVEVWVTTDSVGDNVVAGTFLTDDSGIARVTGSTAKPMLDDDVVYYGWRDSPTNQFTSNPIQFQYSSANSQWELWDGTTYNAWDGISNDASTITGGSSSTSFQTSAGVLIRVNKSRGITKDLTIVKADESTIIPQSGDIIRVVIGREGRLGTNNADANLVVTSAAATSAGSSFTKGGGGGAKNRLRLDATDLAFAAGVYTMWFEMYDDEDADEWKLVSKHIFVLEE